MELTNITPVGNEVAVPQIRKMLYLGGDTTQHIGYVSVYNGVNVIEYTVDKQSITANHPLLILPIGNSLKEEMFGAFDRTRHQLPY